ncbi:MAG: hypothetical protein JWM11_3518 [Planctomycetaceae bacterium]|nr:hypothetical protein [Planctomycetaceae bacterium]
MSFSFLCPHCDAKIKLADERHIGKKVPCPGCRTPIVIQRPEEANVEEIDAEEELPVGSETPLPELPSKKRKIKPKTEITSVVEESPKKVLPLPVYAAGGFAAVVFIGLVIWWLIPPAQEQKSIPEMTQVQTLPPSTQKEEPQQPIAAALPQTAIEMPKPESRPQQPPGTKPVKKLSPQMVATFQEEMIESQKAANPQISVAEITEKTGGQFDRQLARLQKEDPDFLCLTPDDEQLLSENKPLPHSERRIQFTIKYAAKYEPNWIRNIRMLKPYEEGKPLDSRKLELLAMMMDKAWKNICRDKGLNRPDFAERLRGLEQERLGRPVTLEDLQEDTRRMAVATAKMSDVEKLKQISRAMHDYHSITNHYPGAGRGRSSENGGKPGLSWRVHLLNVLEQSAINEPSLLIVSVDRPEQLVSSKDFHLDEPWDSPHNLLQVERMPNIYQFTGASKGKTTVHVAIDAETPFGGDRVTRKRSIQGGTSYTFMVVVGGPETAVEWTKPGGLELNSAPNLAALLGTPPEGGYVIALFDGAIRRVAKDPDFANFKEMFSMENKTGKPRDIEHILQPRR